MATYFHHAKFEPPPSPYVEDAFYLPFKYGLIINGLRAKFPDVTAFFVTSPANGRSLFFLFLDRQTAA
jgi:hypothetical protein